MNIESTEKKGKYTLDCARKSVARIPRKVLIPLCLALLKLPLKHWVQFVTS